MVRRRHGERAVKSAFVPALLTAAAAACVVASFPACSPVSAPSQASLAADEAAITEFNRRYLQAINDGDIDRLAALTTEGHVMIGSGRPPLVGKTALVDTMTRAFERFEIDESWTPEETVISGDLAFQRGTYVVEATPKGGGERTRSTGNFARIYMRQPDGAWFMTRDVLASDQRR
jgi:ketosteroid isomerase-like protein